MKWKSVLFSELSNKLGDQIVGARWKGRGYFRSYVIPANPKSLKQRANRDTLDKILKHTQSEILDDVDIKAAWNAMALPLLISGYNLVMKYGRKSQIAAPPTGTADSPVELTYTCGIPLAKAGIFKITDSTVTEVVAAGGLEAGEDKTVNTGNLAAGTYYFWIADATVLKGADSWPQLYQGCTKWSVDEANGVAKPSECVVS